MFRNFKIVMYCPLDQSVPEQPVGYPWQDCDESREQARDLIDEFNQRQYGEKGAIVLMAVRECSLNCERHECEFCRKHFGT